MDQENEGGSRLIKAIEAVAITPQDARALVSQYKAKARQALPEATDLEIEQSVVEKIVSRYAAMCATSGGATALTGVIPGIGTAIAMVGGGLADATITLKFQVDMVMCIADAAGWDITTEDAKHVTFLIVGLCSLEKFGVEEGTKIASKAGVKMLKQYLSGAALITVKEIFKRVGITFSRAAVERAIPFGVGVALGGSVNYFLTKYIGNSAYETFVIEREIPTNPDEVSNQTIGDPA